MYCFKADHVAFRYWLCKEVLWSTIERNANDLYKSQGKIHKHIATGESFEDWLEAAKQVHRQEAFAYELQIMKTKGKQEGANVKKTLPFHVGHIIFLLQVAWSVDIVFYIIS